MHNGTHYTPQDAEAALQFIEAGTDRQTWTRYLMSAKAAGVSEDAIIAWSATASNFKSERDVRDVWRSISPDGGIGPGTLYHAARQGGWKPHQRNESGTLQQRPIQQAKARPEPVKRPAPGMGAVEVWERCKPAQADHGYILAKQGIPTGLRVVPEGDPLTVAGQSMAGTLVVPVVPLGADEPTSLQFIPTPAMAANWKAADRPGKLNLTGAPMAGVFVVGELERAGTAYIVEGIGQAWACWKATGNAAVVCFGWGQVKKVAPELRQRDPAARLVLVPDRGKEKDAEAIARDIQGEFVTMPEDTEQNFDANDLAQRDGFDVLEDLLMAKTRNPSLPFALVPFGDLATAEPPPPSFVWEGLIPAGHVTLLAAHGGTGKSMVALMLAVSVALGLPLFGIQTRRGIAAFYSGEDGAGLLRHRLRTVCRAMGVNVEDLDGRLFIIDATDDDPTLFSEVNAGGRREGATTPTYAGLRQFINKHEVSFVVVDNASDAYDAGEIDRARVRGFMRALASIARERDAGVLLLAHVDKGTSRGERSGSEGYSGSTAWNNSARSRLFMSRDKDGALLLEHQKHNLGRLHEPLRLLWLEGGIPQVDEAPGPMVQGIADRSATKALLKLIAEFTERGEFVTTATTSRTHAAKLLHHEATYPKLKDAAVFDLLRRAERAGHLERVPFKGSDRHQRERWQVTAGGKSFAGVRAATAGTAATTEDTAPDAKPATPAATAATSPPGGVGETAPHKVTAEAPAGWD